MKDDFYEAGFEVYYCRIYIAMELNYCVTYTSNWVRLIGGLLVDVVKGCGKWRRSSSCCCCCRPPVPCCRCCPLKYLLLS